MKLFNKNITLILLLLIGVSCSKEENTSRKGILIFGWFADSSCGGDCADIYMIENGKIYKDIDHNFPETNFFEGNFQELTNANYQDYKVLMDKLPKEIFDEPDGYLDCSECTNDWGGFYLEFKGDDGFHKTWRIRNALYPDYIKNYRSLLLDKLAELNSL
ncbi:hypothetical protein ACFSKN_01140 [Mariniflexile gromovii]|uniref:Lipoprotein n=1 Tax=Mariniflexile gromovii TaxID=362523 RepID=A0ABS4BSD5_9FLAO|nr:hypothetical protein [Mariniflexile gromovii]MBP0903480.1 hypothetical protein [Mariniflexile gromovii]